MMMLILGILSVLFNALSIASVFRPVLYFHWKRGRSHNEPVYKRPPYFSIPSATSFILSSSILLVYIVYFEHKIASIIVCLISDVTLFVFFILRKPSKYEVVQITRNNDMNVGYGCATWYYYNYLKKIRDSFQERVNSFVTEQEVEVIPKLFILFPLSGINKDYVDNSEHIQRCRELLTFTCDFSGTSNREYNLTVYQIINPSNGNSVRCILEYAQPLKALKCFENYTDLSQVDMCEERKIFYKTLKELLKDDKNSYELYELVEFDDSNSELHEFLFDFVKTYRKCL